MQPFKILSIVTLTFLAISTSSCKTADTETSMLSSSEEQSAIEPLKLTEAEKKIIDENVETLKMTNACIECDLRGADLRGADLRGADLEYSDLEGANLTKANLLGAYLTEAKLTKANLEWADLTSANLEWADLTKADLEEADLSGAKIFGTTLPEDLKNAIFKGAKTGPVNTVRLLGKR